MNLTLPYPPSINHYWRVVNGRPIKSAEGRKYTTVAALMAKSQLGPGTKPLSGNLAVSVTVYRPKRIGDLDNTLKVLLDSLKGIAFEDDSQIVHIEAFRDDDAKNPRAIVRITSDETP